MRMLNGLLGVVLGILAAVLGVCVRDPRGGDLARRPGAVRDSPIDSARDTSHEARRPPSHPRRGPDAYPLM